MSEYLAAARKAMEWLASQQSEDGSLAGAEDWFFSYYKVPLAFSAAGDKVRAERTNRYIERKFFPSGKFREGSVYPAATTSELYRLSWLTLGANELGNHGLVQKVVSEMRSAQHAKHGGIMQTSETGDPTSHAGTTAAAATVLAVSGALPEAISAGESVLSVMRAQDPESGALIFLTGEDGGLLPSKNASRPTSARVQLHMPGQIYWTLGYALVAFATLLVATGDRRWSAGGDLILSLVAECDKEIYGHITSGKLCWGAGLMYRATRDERYRDIAERLGRWFAQAQLLNGAWLRPNFSSFHEQPQPESIDTTAERAFVMFRLVEALQ